jgi:hypothetical protein
MNSMPISRVIRAKPFLTVLCIALFIVVADAVITGLAMHDNFADMGNDDIMRLLLVRDWLAGQGWYDVAQYRLLPPEGVAFHWSRYLDVGIAAIILPLSFFLPMDTAEQVAVSVWPTLIMILNLFVIGFGTRRIFGASAACFAIMCTVIWPVTGDLHSGAGNLDHHNVQMLMMTMLAFAVVWPDRAVLAGIVGGLAAAFSLAIGLESLPFIVAAGLVLLWRSLIVPTPSVRRLLLVFCVTLGLGSVLLWLGQMSPEVRLNPVCDQLGTPTLSLIGIAIIAVVLPMALGRWLSGSLAYLAVAIVLTTAGIVVAWPLLSVCLDGPYAQLPLVLQDFISLRITEAQPGLAFAKNQPESFLIFTLPVFVAVAFGVVQWRSDRKTAEQGGSQTVALGLLLVLCLVGIVMIFVQMRTVIMAASVIPIVGGYVIARQLEAYLKDRNPTRGLLVLFTAVTIISPLLVATTVHPFLPSGDPASNAMVGECRRYDSLTALNDVPPAVIINHISLGPVLLWATHHSVVSAGYHVSAEALSNSILPFQLNNDEMADYVRATDATHLLLCRGYKYDGDFATALADGSEADWLRSVPLADDDQLLFEVLR